MPYLPQYLAMISIPSKFYGYPGFNFFKGKDPVGFWDDSQLFLRNGFISKVKVASGIRLTWVYCSLHSLIQWNLLPHHSP